MLEKYFSKPQTVDRIRCSWIANNIEQYVDWLEKQGYPRTTIARRVPIIVAFGDFAQHHGAKKIEDLPDYVKEFAIAQEARTDRVRTEVRRKQCIKELSTPVRQMLGLMFAEFNGGRVLGRYTGAPSLEHTEIFFVYLREERGLTKWTLRVYDYALRLFQKYTHRIGLHSVKELSPTILSGFVADNKERLGKSAMTSVCSSIRIFLKFLYRERLIDRDLGLAIESPQKYHMADLPRSISWDNVRQMLESVDRRSPVGRRDYAILLLLVTYGLRAREVASIKLEDIDWKREQLTISGRKAGHTTAYPLSKIVGEAILEYLRKDRPETAERELFFRVVSPVVPLSWNAVSSRASAYIHKAGIKVARPGSHTLRHTCVQRLVDAHFSFKLIGDYVGHRSPDSTKIYSKMDISSLRELSLGVEEELT
jgi:site-specific recombinase XerD